jgi:hypothetical protein
VPEPAPNWVIRSLPLTALLAPEIAISSFNKII